MSDNRLHFVLVPGFGCFDALGQINYYAGVTPVFRRWRDGLISREISMDGSSAEHRADKSRTILHTFDNFPTACTRTRAQRLRRFLSERIARAEFSMNERVVLIGHSTAGLDIRRMICDLHREVQEGTAFNEDGFGVTAKEVLDALEHVVFISVPQKGSNIACWTDWLWIFAKLSLADLRTSVEVSQMFLVNQLETLLVEAFAMSDIDIIHAVRDALAESRLRVGATPAESAAAQEASAELALWLRHIFWDFSSIKDMAPPASAPRGRDDMAVASPAHFSDELRKSEIDIWRQYGISTRSYATIATSPFEGTVLNNFNPFSLINPQAYLRMLADAIDCKVDLPFAASYQLCSSGTFAEKNIAAPTHVINRERAPEITAQDNDGIVNTASMLWPHGDDTVLVHGDHMDIVGHYRRVPNQVTGGRRYQAYDLLRSESGFSEQVFETVWCDVFNTSLIKHHTPTTSSSSGRKKGAAAMAAVG